MNSDSDNSVEEFYGFSPEEQRDIHYRFKQLFKITMDKETLDELWTNLGAQLEGTSNLIQETNVVLNQISEATLHNTNQISELSTKITLKNSINDKFQKIDLNIITKDIPVLNLFYPDSIVSFTLETDNLAKLNLVSEHFLLKFLFTKIHKNAKDFWANYLEQARTWNFIKKDLIENYLSASQLTIAKDRFVNRRQKDDETFSSFITDITKYAKLLQPESTDSSIINIIFAHVNAQTFELIKLMDPPDSIAKLNELGRKISEITARSKFYKNQKSNLHNSISNQQNTQKSNTNNGDKLKYKSQYNCTHCKKSGHTIKFCSLLKNQKVKTENTNPFVNNITTQADIHNSESDISKN